MTGRSLVQGASEPNQNLGLGAVWLAVVLILALVRLLSERHTSKREGFVTPESVDAWGDFAAAQDIANSALKISMTALWGIDAPDVAYVRLVDTDQWQVPDMRAVPATAIVTLVWRPEIAVVPGSSWRIHAMGEPVHPIDVPRTAPGFDPRTLA